MKESTKRSILRWIYIVLSIPTIGYVYSPFEELPNDAPVVRFVSIPVLVLAGLWMWKGQAIRRKDRRPPRADDSQSHPLEITAVLE